MGRKRSWHPEQNDFSHPDKRQPHPETPRNVSPATHSKKYDKFDMTICNYNAALPWDEKYDVIICYQLLHELPLKTRRKVMDNVLDSLATGGKAVFVDDGLQALKQ